LILAVFAKKNARLLKKNALEKYPSEEILGIL